MHLIILSFCSFYLFHLHTAPKESQQKEEEEKVEEMNKGTFKINLKPVAQRLVVILMIIIVILIILIIIVILMILMTKTVQLIMMMVTRFNSWRGKKSFEKSADSDPKTASKKVDLNPTHAIKKS